MKNILKALIVDDERDLCFLLEQILKHENFDATSLNSIQEAGKRLFDLNPAIIFLDNQLPDGTGIQFIPLIKKTLPKTRVVMMTAYNSDRDEKEAIIKGADCFLKKPLTMQIIERTLGELGLKEAC